jgi:dCMP deaminase
MTHHRPGWDEYFLGIAKAVAARGECVRSQVGAVIVWENRIVATGYNGVAAGQPSCLDGACPRGTSGVARRSAGGPGYEVAPCIAFHAEDNAVTDAYTRGLEVIGATIYVTKEPCVRCARCLAGLLMRVVWHDDTRGVGGTTERRGRAGELAT